MTYYNCNGRTYQVVDNKLIKISYSENNKDLMSEYPIVHMSDKFNYSWVKNKDILYDYLPVVGACFFFCRNEDDFSFISVISSLS